MTRIQVRLASGGVLPPTLTADELAAMVGVSVWQIRAQDRAGSGIVPSIRLGHRQVWPTAPTLEALGIRDFTVETVAT